MVETYEFKNNQFKVTETKNVETVKNYTEAELDIIVDGLQTQLTKFQKLKTELGKLK